MNVPACKVIEMVTCCSEALESGRVKKKCQAPAPLERLLAGRRAVRASVRVPAEFRRPVKRVGVPGRPVARLAPVAIVLEARDTRHVDAFVGQTRIEQVVVEILRVVVSVLDAAI